MPESVIDPNAAPAPDQGAELNAAVDSILETMRSAGAKLQAGAAALPAPVQPSAPARKVVTQESLTKTANDQGFGAAIGEFTEGALLPTLLDTNKKLAKAQRDIAMTSPEVAKLATRFKEKIESAATQRGGDSYIAENGYAALVMEIANQDPTFQNERIEARAQEIAASRVPAPVAGSAPAVAPTIIRSEGVHAGVVAAPSAPSRTMEDEIRATVLTPEEETARGKWRMTAAEAKKQKIEVARLRVQYGDEGIKALGGIPVISLQELGIPEYVEN